MDKQNYIGLDKNGLMILCRQAGARTEYYEISRYPVYLDDCDIEAVLTEDFEIKI